MTPFNYILFIIAGVVGYMMIIDENVVTYLILMLKIMKVNTERFFWMVRYHPNNFITTWIQNRKYDRIARELEKEFNK
jgi:hypothetical protein